MTESAKPTSSIFFGGSYGVFLAFVIGMIWTALNSIFGINTWSILILSILAVIATALVWYKKNNWRLLGVSAAFLLWGFTIILSPELISDWTYYAWVLAITYANAWAFSLRGK